jgi:hypothetical protein
MELTSEELRQFFKKASIPIKSKLVKSKTRDVATKAHKTFLSTDTYKKSHTGSQTKIVETRVVFGEKRTQTFFFAIGEKVTVCDCSYNEDYHNGKKRNGFDSSFFRCQATIHSFSTKILKDEYGYGNRINDSVSLNLIIKFPNGTMVYIAPCCVSKSKY